MYLINPMRAKLYWIKYFIWKLSWKAYLSFFLLWKALLKYSKEYKARKYVQYNEVCFAPQVCLFILSYNVFIAKVLHCSVYFGSTNQFISISEIYLWSTCSKRNDILPKWGQIWFNSRRTKMTFTSFV